MGGGNGIADWVASTGLLSLRIAPVFAFAPPFTLTRMPRIFLALLGIGVAAILVSTHPATARLADPDMATIVSGIGREAFLGLVPLVVLQFLFGALYMAGRTIDIQSGYGLALLIDPTTRSQTPLVGTLFAYLAAASFFAMDGHLGVVRFFAASLEVAPLASAFAMPALVTFTSYTFVVSLIAFGVAGGGILAMFLADIVVAMLSRTVPQMNALLLGIQVKGLLLLFVLPLVLGISGALFVQMVTDALSVMLRLM